MKHTVRHTGHVTRRCLLPFTFSSNASACTCFMCWRKAVLCLNVLLAQKNYINHKKQVEHKKFFYSNAMFARNGQQIT